MKLEVITVSIYDSTGENNFQPYAISIYVPNILAFRPFKQFDCEGTIIETIGRSYTSTIPFEEFSDRYLKEHSCTSANTASRK